MQLNDDSISRSDVKMLSISLIENKTELYNCRCVQQIFPLEICQAVYTDSNPIPVKSHLIHN